MIELYLSDRELNLLNMLKEESDFCSMKYFSEKLNVSTRTISSDVNKINESLKNSIGCVEKKSGVGIKYVEHTTEISIEGNDNAFLINDKKERIIIIVQQLLFENKIVTYEQLISQFYISRTSISNELDEVEMILTKGNNIKLVRDNKGTRLLGPEKEFRKAHLEFNQWVYTEIISNKNDNPYMIEILKRFYGDVIVSECYNVLYDAMKSDIESIADYYVINVLKVLIVIVHRISIGKNNNEELNFKKDYYLDLSCNFLEAICDPLKLTFTEGDAYNLSEYLISNKFQLVSKDYGSEILPEIFKKLDLKFNLKFNIAKITHQQLSNHISTMIYRLKNGIRISNPFLHQIKSEYSEMFNILWIILSEYEQTLGVKFTEDEIGFLVVYLQSTIEQKTDGRHILVVCPWGLAASNLLVKQIERICQSNDKVRTASMEEVNNGDVSDDNDLIISTIDLEIPTSKYIKVSSILTEENLVKLQKKFDKKINKIDKLNSYKNISKYIENEYIMLNKKFQNMDEAIEHVSGLLVDTNRATNDLQESIIQREKLGGTDLETRVAIPHSNPKHVKQSTIVFIQNNQEMHWINYKVKYIMFVCIAEKDLEGMRDVFQDIYKIIETKENLKEFFELINKKMKGGVVLSEKN